MLRTLERLSVAGAVVVLVLAPVHVLACSRSAPPTIDEIVSGDPLFSGASDVAIGVFEQEHIAASPGIILFEERTVSVVTRYWGTPPPRTGLEKHGTSGLLSQSSCGNEAGRRGLVGYQVVTERSIEHADDTMRGLPWVDVGTADGQLAADQEAALTARFGPPVVLGISISQRIGAWLLAWTYQLVLLGMVGAVAFIVIRSRRNGPTDTAPGELDEPDRHAV